jgi:hypothetical protein
MYKICILGSDTKVNDFVEALLFEKVFSSSEIQIVSLASKGSFPLLHEGIYISTDIHQLINCTEAILLISNEKESLNSLSKISGKIPTTLTVFSFIKNMPLDKLIEITLHKAIIRVVATPFIGQDKNGLIFWAKKPNLNLLSLPSDGMRVLSQLGDIYEVPSEEVLEQSSNWIETLISGVEQSLKAFVDTGVESGLPEGIAKDIALNLWKQPEGWFQETFSVNSVTVPPIFDELDFSVTAMPNLYQQLKSILVSLLLLRSHND